jgi:acetolactate decarboxylase
MKKIFAVSMLFLVAGCIPQANRITQTSTIDALLAGAYDGQIECGKLLDYGDFGIGTFDKLDGEMAIVDGRIYQVKSDGIVYTPSSKLKTPFASVCKFNPDMHFELSNVNFKTVTSTIDEKISNPNQYLAVKITGKFKHMKVRSVPAQSKPYPPLVKVAKTQPVFEANDVTGTIVGFRTPPFAKGLNVTGYHFHFLSKHLAMAGHVLDFELTEGKCQIDKCNELLLILPKDDVLKDIDLSKDKSKELQKAEK